MCSSSHLLESNAARRQWEGRREKEMANVATALVESSAAETLLVVIVAMAMAVVLGALLVQRFDPS